MPTFCRHNRLLQNCPICSREQAVELRPVVSPGAPRAGAPRASAPSADAARTRASGSAASRSPGGSKPGAGVRVSRLARGIDDGYRSRLVPGLRSSVDAQRLAEELAFAAGRLSRLAVDPPGCYAEIADPGGDLEERTWLAFLIAYICPAGGEDPFAAIRAVRTSWASGEQPALEAIDGEGGPATIDGERVPEGLEAGPRTAHDPRRGLRTIEAYRSWASRAGSQAAAFTGEAAWAAQRRFARAFERLSLSGFHRDARFDLLASLGRLGVYDLRAGALQLGGDDPVTVAAKRALGIGDPLLLERRAAELASACGLPLEALDLGFDNWERSRRASLGLEPGSEPDPEALAATRAALGL
ncbi:MAG: hypothetical protein M3Y17_07335 [Actinomycetota bacterium]|nr:hypothetical protein [Actinomycetota bacterium]